MPRVFNALAVVVALLAAALGQLWLVLPQLIGRVRQRPADSVGLQRLRISHAMAGGVFDADLGDATIADAVRSMAVAAVAGPRADAVRRGVRVEARDAWRAFGATLLEAEHVYLSPRMGFGLGDAAHAEQEVAEGFKFAADVARLALDLHMSAAPRFVPMVSPTLKLLGDNPDAYYFISALDDGASYTVTGCRTAEVYLSLSVHAHAEPGKAFQRVVADVNDSNLTLDADGCWALALSAEKPESGDADWLRLPADAATVVTRHYFEPIGGSDGAPAVPAQLHEKTGRNIVLDIVRSDDGGAGRSTILSDGSMARRLRLATEFVRAHTVDMPQPDPTTAPPFFSLVPNTIGPPELWSAVGMEGMGAVDIAYSAGRFLFADPARDALVITGRMPPQSECRFANVVLWNRFLQTFDYEAAQARGNAVSLTRRQMHLDADGNYVLILAAADPFEGDRAAAKKLGANWMDTEGRATGTVFMRFVLPEVLPAAPATRNCRFGGAWSKEWPAGIDECRLGAPFV